jgi:serine-type D-Ala-D-Ala carboxypeptidase/endopeptidase (penicillin-binding protein 4)
MKRFVLIVTYCLLVNNSFAQSMAQKLQRAYQQFEVDSQLTHATSSLYVINAKTGKVVFEKNSQVGLAPASTQKIFTAITAFDLLGSNYTYQTLLYLNGKIKADTLDGDFIIKGSGDPSLGSWRYASSARTNILSEINALLKKKNINYIKGNIILDESSFETNTVPGGWIWDDIGNYYGAGAWGINWNENQYTMFLESGPKEGDTVSIKKTDPPLEVYTMVNELRSGAKGSGDNGYIYLPPYTFNGFVRGTIPPGEDHFAISGSMPYPCIQLGGELEKFLKSNNIKIKGKYQTSLSLQVDKKNIDCKVQPSGSISSPSLDSLIYWFLKKSINLYGEALMKTFAYKKNGFGSTDKGIAIVKDFWKQKGLDESELNISDGSGLSPQNRVTTHAQVEVLKYAKNKDWFPYFYNALPEYNGMKMKSGSIRDVKGFCGYQKGSDGNEYIFSFLINNYNGSSSGVVNKMYKVLDMLKE